MSDKILYFPEIRVPDSAWFTRMLLYWDSVGTIIPREFIERPEDLGEHTRSLLQAELVTPVIPGMFLYQIPRFAEAFAHYLESLGPKLDRRRRRFLAGATTEVHVEKLGDLERVMREYELCKRGNGKGYSQWYAIERQTARDFMAYLAAALGRLEEFGSVPVTNRKKYWKPLLRESDRPVEHRATLTSLRTEILKDILPAPKRPLSADQIQAFKARHKDQLTSFRRTVEREIVDAASIGDPEIRRRRLLLFREEIDDQVKEVEARLRESGFGDLVFGKIFSVMAEVPGVSFVFGLASAVYDALQKSPAVEPPSPLVYAAYARAELL
jgi:hypothetical protein